MKILIPSTRYKKDLKRVLKRGWNLEKLEEILKLLEMEKSLPISARPHKLTGEWLGFWECHIAPDWLLIYDASDTLILLAGTGTHADLFK